MDEQQYRMTLTDVQWWCCDIPGNIGWIIWIVCNVKTLIEGVDLYAILMLLPTALMVIGVVELISERIAKLDRILPRLRLYRGFGSLTLGGILGVPMAIAGLV
ncbi:MAG: hypothetical protein K5869_00920, partial [Saccharofermentans sp.]|nr:hypothetical protein [Saccharofermentans sp.]